MKSLERKNNFIHILIFIFLISIFVLYYFNINRPVFTQVYPASFQVSNHVGFDLNATALKFGMVIPESESSKELNVENQYDFPIEVRLYVSKNLDDLFYVKDRVIIEPNQTKSFFVYLYVPKNQAYGNYSGEIKLGFFKI